MWDHKEHHEEHVKLALSSPGSKERFEGSLGCWDRSTGSPTFFWDILQSYQNCLNGENDDQSWMVWPVF